MTLPARRHVAFATRELHPFVAGGIAPIVAAIARALARDWHVTLVTSAAHAATLRERGGAEALYGPGVEVVLVEEPPGEAYGPYLSHAHAWSARLWEAMAARWAGGGAPDLIEFCDYMAEGFVTVQARRAGDPRLDATAVTVRTHTTAELTSVLDGSVRSDVPTRAVFEAERYCLRHADRLLVPGGDVAATYGRFYGGDALAPAIRVREAFLSEGPEQDGSPRAGGPLRMLFLGRLERRKGVLNLVRALLGSEHQDWELTLLGGDTRTGPLRTVMGDVLELGLEHDPRVARMDEVARDEVGAVIAEHDLVVVPSLWECWPNVVREAFRHNRPVLGTPVGGLVEMVEPGRSGFLAEGTDSPALLAALEPLVADPARVRALSAQGGPRAAFARLVDEDATRADYAALLETAVPPPPARPRRRRHRHPRVSVVVPYFHTEDHVAETLASVRAQTEPVLEVLLVVDGSFRPQDAFIADLADEHGAVLLGQPNSGLSAARNFGIGQARGDLVLPLDSDNVLEPEFVATCLDVLDRHPDAAYATSWARHIDEHGELLDERESAIVPFGNWSALIDVNNVGGDGTAILRRALFDQGFAYHPDLASFEDWFLYRQLHHAGHWGLVVPRWLFRYRVRRESMLRTVGLDLTPKIFDEMTALMAEAATSWTAPA